MKTLLAILAVTSQVDTSSDMWLKQIPLIYLTLLPFILFFIWHIANRIVYHGIFIEKLMVVYDPWVRVVKWGYRSAIVWKFSNEYVLVYENSSGALREKLCQFHKKT